MGRTVPVNNWFCWCLVLLEEQLLEILLQTEAFSSEYYLSPEVSRAPEAFGQCSQSHGGILGVSCEGPGVDF